MYSERICFTKLIFIPLTEATEHEVIWDLLNRKYVNRAVLSMGFSTVI